MSHASTTPPQAAPATQARVQTQARQIHLLSRHWAWLEAQPRSASAALRLLIDAARHDSDGRYRIREAKEACYGYMRDAAGDRPHFEEAIRALFAGELTTLQQLIQPWPVEVRDNITALVTPIAGSIAETEKPR